MRYAFAKKEGLSKVVVEKLLWNRNISGEVSQDLHIIDRGHCNRCRTVSRLLPREEQSSEAILPIPGHSHAKTSGGGTRVQVGLGGPHPHTAFTEIQMDIAQFPSFSCIR